MPINSDKPHLWKADVAQSIDFYNDWFLRFAPGTYRKQRFIRTNDPLLSDLEKKQLAALKRWLLRHGYKQIASDETSNFDAMPSGTFTIPITLPVKKKQTSVKTPIDCLVKPLRTNKRDQPFVIELKASGSATTTNRLRRKKSQKFTQLKERYGENIGFILLFCGYFDPGYLGYVGSEGIEWIWEHRLNDLSRLLVDGKISTRHQMNLPPASCREVHFK
jgi:hypothetical protein